MAVEYTAQQLAEIEPIGVEEFRFRLKQLFEEQKAELSVLAGTPPDHRKVPRAAWERWEEQRRKLLLWLMLSTGLWLANDEWERLQEETDDASSAQMRRFMANGAARRARKVSGSMTGASKRMMRRSVLAGTESDDGEADPDIVANDVFSDDRLNNLVRNEIVAAGGIAKTAVAQAGIEAGVEVIEIWMLGPCDNHCEVCIEIDGTTRDVWEDYAPDGCPLHINCCCSVILEYNTPITVLQRRSIVRRTMPSKKRVRAVMTAHGISSDGRF